MHRKKYLKILTGIVSLILIIKLLTLLFIEPRIREKTEAALSEKIKDYSFRIEKVHIKLISSGIKVDGIKFFSKSVHGGNPDLTGEIKSIKIKGINLLRALFKKDIKIRELIISAISIKGVIPFPEKSKPPVILPLNIHIGEILIDKAIVSVKNSLNSQSFHVNDGIIKVYNLHLIRQDTLSKDFLTQFDFDAREVISVSKDSMYTYSVKDISYSSTENNLSAGGFTIHPNYTDYKFTSRYKYQKNRIEAILSNISFQNFNASDFLISKKIASSDIEIGNIEMNLFRDKRKEFRHVRRVTFQDMIYSYHGLLKIDTISISKGNIHYTEHAEKANNPGYISFSEINAKIYNITNDSLYKTEKGFLELRCNSLLMGKGKLTILLKSRIFDSQNTFSVSGILSEMEIADMNPYLEKNAFIYASSGKIDEMSFRFTANNTKAAGNMTMLYKGLDIAVKNKDTDDTTAFRERFISKIANRKMMDSNPVTGEEVRNGIIEYERDPEKFLFSYCVKSILSGIKSSLFDRPKKMK